MMTADEREALERELTMLDTYVRTVRTEGPERFLNPNRPGWRVTLLSGSEVVGRKNEGIRRVWAESLVYTQRAREIWARIDAAEWDAERAAETPEEREASARAQAEADGPRGFARSRPYVGRRLPHLDRPVMSRRRHRRIA